MTLNDPYPRFQGHSINSLTLNISETVRDTDTVSVEYNEGSSGLSAIAELLVQINNKHILVTVTS